MSTYILKFVMVPKERSRLFSKALYHHDLLHKWSPDFSSGVCTSSEQMKEILGSTFLAMCGKWS